MGLNVQCKKCANLRNDWCKLVFDSPDPDMVRDCQHYRGKTNADKYFRNATDEEIARFLAKAQADILRTVGRVLKYPGDLVRDCDLEDAADDWLYWLKQEVNDGT